MYTEVNINRSPPFIVIQKSPKRVHINFKNEEMMKNGKIYDGFEAKGAQYRVESTVDVIKNDDLENSSISKSTVHQILECSKWFVNHIEELAEHPSGEQQLCHINTAVFQRLMEYKKCGTEVGK